MADKAPETAAPATHPESGLAMHGEFPLNSLLRAEALHAAGNSEDPDGIVTAEAIEDAGKRRARLDKADEEAARERPSLKWSREDLVAEAARIQAARGIAEPLHEGDANKPTILAAIEAHASETEN